MSSVVLSPVSQPSVLSARAPAFTDTHERIVEARYRLFIQWSVRDVAMDEIVVASGVAKATLYRHFATKDALALAIFDVFDDWFQLDDYEACTFVSVLLEMGADHPLGRASSEHLANIRGGVTGFAGEAGLTDPEEFARSWHILMKGCIVQAAEGDRRAARRARALGAMLIAANRAAAAPQDGAELDSGAESN